MKPTRATIRSRIVSDFLARPIMDNALRGYWCEAMVAEALGNECRLVSHGWHPWDLQFGPDTAGFPERIRIQVKNTAAIQTWHAGKPSDCQFALSYRRRPVHFDRDAPGVACEEYGFLCELFILCHHPVEDQAIADQIDPGQWAFFLLPVVGPHSGITDAERAWADDKCRTSGRSSNCIRRPATMSKGIRSRQPIAPIGISELTTAAVLRAIGARP